MTIQTKQPEQAGPSWKNRRRVILATLLFCALTVGYVLWKGDDTKIGETAITMSFFLAGSTVGGYVFGAAWENVQKPK